MGTIKEPLTLSQQFGLSPQDVDEAGVVDVVLNSDTLLFIDPMLLPDSQHKEMSVGASDSYRERFEQIIKLLAASKKVDDVAWKAAKKKFKFSEIGWTCLGYASGTSGSGFGKDLIETTLEAASQIVELGVDDPDLFMALALFEEGVGPDRISDMTTNIILEDLIEFNTRKIAELGLKPAIIEVDGRKLELLINPFTEKPLLMVPTDIVRDLPIASDWSDISRVTRENEELRDRVNACLGEVWATMTRKQKQIMKERAMKSKDAFQEVLNMLRAVDPEPYNFKDDRNGEVRWTRVMSEVSRQHPFDLSMYQGRKLDIKEVKEVVDQIIQQFQDLVENKGLWKCLWTEDERPCKEKAAQRLLFAVASSYCKANDLDLTPEADAGNGPVDFKVSQGHTAKVLVEVKLSKGTVEHGYEKQLEIYKRADDTDIGIFLIIDVGSLGKKLARIQAIRDQHIKENGKASDIVLVDAHVKASASKR
ncbi:hypothetical protein [Vibrio sp.]|uniref:hypothetical protein n=1 Tax=Vibrio sp. TaxID=678 RepID=UPI003AA7E3E5